MVQKRPKGVVRPPLVRVQQETPPPPSVLAAGERSIAIGGNMHGSISTGLVGTPKVVERRSTDIGCRHAAAVEVLRAVDDELVAWWCAECETQLPADFVGYRGLDKPPVGYIEQPAPFRYDPDPMLTAWNRLQASQAREAVREREARAERKARQRWSWGYAVALAVTVAAFIACWVEVIVTW